MIPKKFSRPKDINQAAKSIVDLATSKIKCDKCGPKKTGIKQTIHIFGGEDPKPKQFTDGLKSPVKKEK